MTQLHISTPASERLFALEKQKRVLTLDGGGVRGIVTIAFLKEMEAQLREATGRKDLVRSDVFDLVAGTSVGSMLATMISLGRPVEEIEARFRELAPRIFSGRMTMFGQKRFNARPLEEGIASVVGDEELGSARLRTGLAIVTKRVDTDSVWCLINNPRMKYYEDGREDDGTEYDGNKRYKLANLIRASTAAPFLFKPTQITIHSSPEKDKSKFGWFVDGGVSPHNNPAFLMLMAAALPSYQLNWKLTPKDLLLISVGTGLHRSPINPQKKPALGRLTGMMIGRSRREDIEEAVFASRTLQSLISNNSVFILKLMQSLSSPRFSWRINTEVGSLENELILTAFSSIACDPGGALKFQRYDLPLQRTRLVPEQFDVDAADIELDGLHAIDNPGNLGPLSTLAAAVAKKQVSIADFDGFI